MSAATLVGLLKTCTNAVGDSALRTNRTGLQSLSEARYLPVCGMARRVGSHTDVSAALAA